MENPISKKDEYRKELSLIRDWEPFLLEHSGLPGPRGNIELAQAVAEDGSSELFEHYRSFTPEIAPVNSQQEFLAFCGVLGLGRLIKEGQSELLDTLRNFASDSRWRIREAVAMALQSASETDMTMVINEMDKWSKSSPLEQRAAAAALCEPRLLGDPKNVEAVLRILDSITRSILEIKERKAEDFLVLRKGLAYCWSVAVAANPVIGKRIMEKWFGTDDMDIRWIMRENLKKKRLEIKDRNWVEMWRCKV